MSAHSNSILIASHRRSGTHVAIDFIRKQFAGTSPAYRWLAPPSTLYVDLDSLKPGHHNPSTPARIARAIERAPRIVIKTHSLPAEDGSFPEFGPNHHVAKAIIERATVINMVRDGRDVLSSQHLFDQTFHTDTPAGFGAFLRGAFGGMPRPAYWAKHVATWAARPGTHTIRFEDMTQHPEQVLHRLADILGLQPRLIEPLLPKRAPDSRLARAVMRLKGDTETSAVVGRPRPGARPQRWRETWSPEDRQFFDQHAGGALVDLGYESGAQQVNP